MRQISGKTISSGIAIGRIRYTKKRRQWPDRVVISDVDGETGRFSMAKSIAKAEYMALYDKSHKELGEKNAAVFEVYMMLLDDAGLTELIEKTIREEKVCAEYAVYSAGSRYSRDLALSGDEYFKARGEDIMDITGRLTDILQGKTGDVDIDEPVILVSEELTPSQTAGLDTDKLLGIVTKAGSEYSHAAVFARMKGVPAVCGIQADEDTDGKVAVLDAYEGVLTIEPDEAFLLQAREKAQKERELLKKLKEESSVPCVTESGKRVGLLANIGGIEDVRPALENGAEGIGLFRSEILFMKSHVLPTEEEQFSLYRDVVLSMKGKRVVIRTLDLGSDKSAPCLLTEAEKDPALGYRGIRISLDRPEIFKTQLRAIYRASAFGPVSILFPMIVSSAEFTECRRYTEEVKRELKSEDVSFGEDVCLGPMIETPAAALISDELAKAADFFSIGTNDLTQYTLAADRNNDRIKGIYDAGHPAVMKLIGMCIGNAHSAGIKVCICGEMAADTTLTAELIELGVDELSVAPSALLKIKQAVRSAG